MAEPICLKLTFRASRNGRQPPINDPLENLGKPRPVSRVSEVEFSEGYCVISRSQSASRKAAHKRSHGIEIMSTVDERWRCTMNAACQAPYIDKKIILLPGDSETFPGLGLPDETTPVLPDSLVRLARQHRMPMPETGRALPALDLTLAHCIDEALRTNVPFPAFLQRTASISALPRAEKRFMIAMRIWISAVWRSGSRDMILSPKSFRQFIRASTRLRT